MPRRNLEYRRNTRSASTTDSFRSFAANHPGHPLTGAAEVTIADNSYGSGKYAEALGAYTSAIADLPSGPIQARARIGQAMSQALTGKTADARGEPAQAMDDTSLLKTTRCEAGYHLAVLALDAGRAGEVQGLAEQLLRIDPRARLRSARSPFVPRPL